MKRLVVILFLLAFILPFVSAGCTDSDSGVNYYVGGNAQDGNQTISDACMANNPKQLSESYCENEIIKSAIYDCQNGCSDGKCLCPTTKCSDGTIYGPEKCTVKENICVCPSCPAMPTTPATCSAPTCEGAKDTGQKDSNGCIIYSCQATPACQPTKCDDGSMNTCQVVNGICTCSTCTAKPIQTCTDSDGGINYYEKGYIDQTFSPSGRHYDSCVNASVVEEWSCIPGGTFRYDNYVCPNGCSDGACIKGEEVKEQVTCIFQNSDAEQKCYTAYDNSRAYCSGVGSCIAYIKGYKGEQITWKSSCGQYQYTTMDGNNEKVGFECSGKTVCQDSDNGKDIYQKGTTSGLDWGTSNIVSKTDYCVSEGEKAGRLAEYYCDYVNGVSMVASQTFGVEDGCYGCSDGRCEQIIVKPVCGNGICEGGEGDVCACPVMSTECKEGKECKVPACVCNVACPQDCKQREGIYANLNEKFKLQVYQPVKITENEKHLMKITFKDLLAYKCENMEISSSVAKTIETKVAIAERTITGRVVSSIASSETSSTTATSSGGGGGGAATPPIASTPILKCVGAGPKALLDVDMIVNSELGNHLILNLDVGEKKQVKEFTVSFLSYDYASRTGVFLVSRETFSCEKGCKCDENGKVIECAGETCKKGETLCPDGVCREKCEMISEDCKYGCLYEGKCFPMGVRSNGLYCGDSLIMGSQKTADEKCENNFECSSNVCVSGKCIDAGFLNKIINWFKKLFGG